MEQLIHVANVLYVLSYLVRDILWLRLLTVVAIVTLIPFYYVKDLITAIVWSVLFLAINLVQVCLLLLERRPVRLTARQAALYRLAFSAISQRDFLKLIDLGEWQAHDDDEVLVEPGESLATLCIIAEGNAIVQLDDEEVATLMPGQFIGEMSYVTGDKPNAKVVACPASRVLKWPTEHLKKFLATHLDVRAALQNVIGSDLASKLRHDQAKAAARA